ncbi:MAG: hypothetical protein U9N57_14180 [Pseudomonadota bacterium]|nr:hypothetical protein [Pseudomonadota bacterium]
MLDDNHVKKFLEGLPNSNLIRRLATQEDWVADESDEVYETAIKIGGIIQQGSVEELNRLDLEEWAVFLSLLSLPRSLLATHSIEEKLNNFTIDLIEESEVTNSASIITQKNRMVALFRTQMIQKIFSEKRANAIIQFMEYKDL